MTEKQVFEKVINSLLEQHYKIDPQSLSYEDVNEDRDPLSKRIRLGIDAVKFISKVFDLGFEPEINPVLKNEKFREDLNAIYPITNYVLFKYVLAQPIIIALVKADDLAANDFKSITSRYDSVMLNFRQHTGRINGTRLSVTGLIFFLFADPVKASEFENKYQQENKIFHFWKKTWTIPWGIDVTNRKVVKHKKLPILLGALIDAKKLEVAVFG